MKAVVCEALGSIDQLTVKDIPVPNPKQGEVRLRVAGCAMNFADALVVQGLYQEKPSLPFVPGVEVAGVVDAVGEGVEALAVGARVMGFTMGRGYAECMCLPASACVPVLSDDADLADMAALPIAYGTAHTALNHRARLEACLLYTSPSPRDGATSRMPSSA